MICLSLVSLVRADQLLLESLDFSQQLSLALQLRLVRGSRFVLLPLQGRQTVVRQRELSL